MLGVVDVPLLQDFKVGAGSEEENRVHLAVREAAGVVHDFDGSLHDADSRFTITSAPSPVEAERGIVVEAM